MQAGLHCHCYCYCHMVQGIPEHPFGSQYGSWGTWAIILRHTMGRTLGRWQQVLIHTVTAYASCKLQANDVCWYCCSAQRHL
jgi:hypothetical protein